MIGAFVSRARRRRREKAEQQAAASIERSRRKAKSAAGELLRMAADATVAIEIREGMVIGAYRECCAEFGPLEGRRVFVEMFGERLLGWVDHRHRAGRLAGILNTVANDAPEGMQG